MDRDGRSERQERELYGERYRDREREAGRDQYRDKDGYRDRDKYRDRDRHRGRERSRSRSPGYDDYRSRDRYTAWDGSRRNSPDRRRRRSPSYERDRYEGRQRDRRRSRSPDRRTQPGPSRTPKDEGLPGFKQGAGIDSSVGREDVLDLLDGQEVPTDILEAQLSRQDSMDLPQPPLPSQLEAAQDAGAAGPTAKKSRKPAVARSARLIEVIANDRLGRKVRVKCSPDDTVGDLKKLIAAQTGTTASKIGLKKWYSIFKDHITLKDYEINDGMSLEMY